MNWPTPRNVTDVRSFMGLAGYCRRFIEGFSKVAHSITSLQTKGIKFEGTPRCEESFQQLKNLLTSAPILKIADPKKYFVVCIDACNQGLGGVLMQDNYVVCYDSRNLKDHEKNYATHDCNTLVLTSFALNVYDVYIVIDHGVELKAKYPPSI